MNKVRVKICGITSTRDLVLAVDAGSDAVGFVVDVPQSPRNLTRDKAKELVESTPVFVETVVVTVSKGLRHLKRLCREFSKSTIQIHRIEGAHEEFRAQLPNARVIASIQAHPGFEIGFAVKAAQVYDAILFDSYVPHRFGGTGATNDWNRARLVRDAIQPKPLVLAGGLTPKNVAEAIKAVRPHAVDVSTGVESKPGTKDPNKIHEFVRNAKEVYT